MPCLTAPGNAPTRSLWIRYCSARRVLTQPPCTLGRSVSPHADHTAR